MFIFLCYNERTIKKQENKFMADIKLNPDEVELVKGFTQDMRNIGHWGTGDLQVIIKDVEDFEKAKPLIDRAYNEN